MHGMINRGLQHYVSTIFGPEVWETTCAEARLPFFNFETMLEYDDKTTERVLVALSEVLKRPPAEVLEDFGTYVVSERQLSPIRRLLRFGGDSFEEFLFSLEDLNGRCRMAMPDLDMPILRLQPDGSARFELRYSFAKPGFAPVFLGLLRAMADDYGALVLIEYQALPESEGKAAVFGIQLVRDPGSSSGAEAKVH